MNGSQQAISTKLRLLNIAHEAIVKAAQSTPEYHIKPEDVRKDATDMTISVWSIMDGEGVRRMFQLKVKEVK